MLINTSQNLAWLGNDSAFSHTTGHEGAGGSWVSSSGFGYLTLGPHVNLAPGIYDVSYTFIISGGPISETKHVATIEVSRDGGLVFISGKLVGGDFGMLKSSSNSINYISFINRITADSAIHDVEFKLYYPNSTVKLGLKDINVFIR